MSDAPNSFSTPDAQPAGPVRTSGKAIASLVLGLLTPVLCIFSALPGIILGILALRDISRSQGRLSGSWMAITGIVVAPLVLLLCMPAMLLPAINAAREAARRTEAMSHMQMIQLGMLSYEAEKQEFPAASSASGLSWRVELLPFLEQQALYEQFHHDEPWDSPHNKQLIENMPEIFATPGANLPAGHTMYQLVTGPGTAYPDPTSQPSVKQISDGITHTAVLVEVDPSHAVVWTKPEDWELDAGNPRAGLNLRPGRAVLLGFFDRSVRSINGDVSDAELADTFRINDGR